MPSGQYHIEGQIFQCGDISAGLYIIPTPIGHLKDITLRALEILSAADLILCEDTRHSRKLLDRYGIKTHLKAYHDHSDDYLRRWVCDEIDSGKSIALISDAGMPVISDPGFKLIEAVQQINLPLTVLPGASAGLISLIGSGLPPHPHLFFGFLAPKQQKREKQLEALKTIEASLIFYEAPHRMQDCLISLRAILGDRQAAIGRELTKQFEENRRGSLSELITHYERHPAKGEIVICVSPPDEQNWSDEQVDRMLQEAIVDMPLKQAANHVAEVTGFSKRDLYQRALVLKNDTPST